MRIFDQIRGHFALLENYQFCTLSEDAPFIITRVKAKTPRQRDWAVVIRPLNGKNENLIYVTDILIVYAWICSTHQWMSLKKVEEEVKNSGINLAQSSYIMALLATFDDVETKRGENAAIRHISHDKKYGKPAKWND
jgi:hypothetical protein